METLPHEGAPMSLPDLIESSSRLMWSRVGIHALRFRHAFISTALTISTVGAPLMAIGFLVNQRTWDLFWVDLLLVAAAGFALLGIPLARIAFEPNDQKHAAVSELARKHPTRVLFFLMDHNRRFLNRELTEALRAARVHGCRALRVIRSSHDVLRRAPARGIARGAELFVYRRLRKAGQRRELRNFGGYLTEYCERLYPIYGFPSARDMSDLLLLRPSRARNTVNAYLKALADYHARDVRLRNVELPDRTGEPPLNAGEALQDAERRLTCLITEAQRATRHVDVLPHAVEIATCLGTGRRIELYLDHVDRIMGASSDPLRIEKARALRRTLETMRGPSLTTLAGLDPWFAGESSTHPIFSRARELRADATREAAARFGSLIGSRFPDRRLTALCIGYSGAVAQALSTVHKSLGCVLVPQLDGPLGGDSRAMIDKLADEKIEARFCDAKTLADGHFKEPIHLVLIGVEAAKPDGTIFHPRFEPARLMPRIHDLEGNPLLVAICETWKIGEWAIEDFDIATSVTLEPAHLDAIVTDHGAHEMATTSSLDGCVSYWHRKAQGV